MIRVNTHKYHISAMCIANYVGIGLQGNRSPYYYEAKQKSDGSKLTDNIVDIFKASRNNCRTRKVQKELEARRETVSGRRTGSIMKQEGLVPNYTTAQFKPQ